MEISEKNLERIQKLYGINEESMEEDVINIYIGNMLDQEQMIQQIEEEQKKLDTLKNNLKSKRIFWKL